MLSYECILPSSLFLFNQTLQLWMDNMMENRDHYSGSRLSKPLFERGQI